ncbi:hypothetical protein MPC4_60106 [Methylocella tundrae]|uniref:Uncharacterized protein n=1 Tax=Methylocella tundrae TaxID=227605 RepID=A0A8B6MAG3_METTU|nr:hypothetical protein MPC1_690006 [Methylocella tundrae]VTZ52017.1 hypothetical protein MPC4_60106 [Methylocella tundrae]
MMFKASALNFVTETMSKCHLNEIVGL